jgi:3-isopropylmalate dehydratase small subunit
MPLDRANVDTDAIMAYLNRSSAPAGSGLFDDALLDPGGRAWITAVPHQPVSCSAAALQGAQILLSFSCGSSRNMP